MRKLQYLSMLVLIVVLITACGSPSVGSVADMSGYEGLDEKDTQVFIVSDVKDFLQRLDQKETFVAYFGFTDCPWCNDAISILNAEAKAAGINIYYINTRPNKHVKANCEIPDYDLLVERIGEYLTENEEGVPYLFVPFVFFVKNGEVVFTHQGTLDSLDVPVEDNSVGDVSEIYNGSLQEIYHQGMAKIKE